ncbi:MAG: transporter permease, partial [Ramlibacter sp.]|nr:transporter permease [Ramlibacter sp.]
MLISRFPRLAAGLAALLIGAAATASETGVTDKEIVVGQSLGLSGPLGELGQDIASGSRAYFESVNEKGGIHGRRVRVITLDDGYQVASTVKNVQQMVEEDQVFALFNIMGTPNSAAVLPLADKAGVPFFSPFTGAELTRAPALPG